MQRPGYFLLRLGGLPFDALEDLRFPELPALVRRIDDGAARVTALAERLCDELHAFVQAQADRSVRQRLIELKRCVHNQRQERAGALLDSLAGALAHAPALRADLVAWVGAAEALQELLNSGPACLSRDLAAVRARLRTAWSSDEFQSGLTMANPRLYQRLTAYLARSEPDDRKARQLEQTALAYYCRMSTKTSPFSTFTYTAAGRFDALARLPAQPSLRSSYTLELALVEELFQAELASERATRRLPLALNETLTPQDDGWLLLARRKRRREARRVPDESFNVVGDGPALRATRELCAGGPLSADEIVAGLSRLLGGKLDDASLHTYVARLRECGLLVPAVCYDSNSPAALANAAQALAPVVGSRASELRAGAGRVCAAVTSLETSCAAQRAATGAQLGSEMKRLAELLGDDGQRLATTSAWVRQDCYLDDDVALDGGAFDGVFDALGALNRLMPLFDAASLLRQQVHEHYLKQHGHRAAPRPLSVFLRDFYAEYYQRWLATADNTVWDPFLREAQEGLPAEALELARLRGAWTDAVQQAIAAGGGRDVELSRELVAAFGDQADRRRGGRLPPSTGYFGQPLRTAQASRLGFVLNQVVSGHGAYVARHCDARLFGERADWLRRQVAASLDAGDAYGEPVELLATFGLNVQMHPLLTPRCIVYPGENVVPGDGAQVIPWAALQVGYDEVNDEVGLFEQPGGKRLRPLRMGPVSPHLLPVLYRVMVSLGHGCVPDFALLSLLEHRNGGTPTSVRRYPRVTFGDLTLLRRTWRVPASAGPPPRRAGSDFSAFMDLRRWARALDLPSRVFVIPVEISDYFREPKRPGNLRRLYKPFYVDFDNPLSCQLLHRFTDNLQSTLTISEMLPAPEQLPLHLGGRPVVSELLLEVS